MWTLCAASSSCASCAWASSMCSWALNLLREGLDLPEVSLVSILDADKEGFLRSTRSLIQTIGRAARNVSGEVYMYADTVTAAMAEAIEETERRRTIREQPCNSGLSRAAPPGLRHDAGRHAQGQASMGRALSGIIGRKEYVGGFLSAGFKATA